MIQTNEYRSTTFGFDAVCRAGLQVRLSEEPDLRREWEQWLEKAEALLEQEFVDEAYADGVHSQHGRYNVPGDQIILMAAKLGLAYRSTQDGRYATKLREGLLYYAGYRKWCGSGLADKDPAWHSELNTARFCYGFAVGYDAIRDTLNDEERRTIRLALIEKGILPTLRDWVLPETRIHAIDTMGHNWFVVCVAMAGLAALSVREEEPEAQGWLEEIAAALPNFFRYQGSVLGQKSPNYDPLGAMYESVNYANYGLYEYLTFRLAYRRHVGLPALEDEWMLEKAGAFFLHTFYPSGKRHLTVNFGDGHLYNDACQASKLLLANGFDDPTLRWYLSRYDHEYDVYDFLFYDSIRTGARSAPPADRRSMFYDRIGWAIMRSGWEDDATLLAIKSGFTWNHAHADAGSFVLFHKGVPLLIDSGNCSYGHPAYIDYYLQSRAHNVVTWNGEAQHPDDLERGVKEPGQLYHLIDQGDFRYVYADSAGPTSRRFARNYRHFLWIGDCLLIYDDLLSHEAGRIEWLLHYEGEAAKTEASLRIENGEAVAEVRCLFPDEPELLERTGLADHDPDRETTYYAISSGKPTREEKFLIAVLPTTRTEGKTPLAAVTPLCGEEWLGARVIDKGKIIEVYVNLRADGRIMHRNGIGTIAGWETDAYLFAITRSKGTDEQNLDAIERVFVAYGSFLRKGETTLFSSMNKATAACSFETGLVRADLAGQPGFEAELRVPDRTSRIVVDGREQPLRLSRRGLALLQHESSPSPRRPG